MPNVGPVTPIALFIAALYATQNLLRYLRAKDANGTVGILIAVISGVAVVALAAHSDVTAGLKLITGGPALGNLDMGSQVLLGYGVGSAGTVLADVKSAFDNTDSSVKPKIVAGPDKTGV